MNNIFADRMSNVKESFVREILKVTASPEVISFAGGLPNPDFFPEKEIQKACAKVLEEDGKNVLQYSTTEGYLPLREYIAERYRQKGLDAHPDQILITNGSQQALDLVGKVFLNKGDKILIEKPGYLGAIQALSMFEPVFESVPLQDDGINIELFQEMINEQDIKLFYTVPNFQNPSGISYSREKRVEVARILKDSPTVLVEDDPYGELRFMGDSLPSIGSFLGENSILLGSFSKIVAPGLRLGWIYTNQEFMEKLVISKQAADLHSNYLAQRVLYQYLSDNNIDEHIEKIIKVYKKQRDAMVQAIESYFPPAVKYTKPEGGMFLWVTLPDGMTSLELFDLARKEDVAFVPGFPFYADGNGHSTLRVNFSNSDEEKIVEGIKRIGKAMYTLLR